MKFDIFIPLNEAAAERQPLIFTPFSSSKQTNDQKSKPTVTHLSRFQWYATKAPFFHGWLTLAPSCLNRLSFPEYDENMWESLRKYLSQADTALHFYSISSLWIFCRSDGKKSGDTPLRVFLKRSFSPHGLLINKELLWVGCGNVNSWLRGIDEIRGVTVCCSACLWD